MDCKATVKLGAFSRGGKTRGEYKASDHDFGGTEQYIPCGIVDEDTAQLYVTFGSSAKTSDFIVDTLAAWWQGLSAQEQRAIDRVQTQNGQRPGEQRRAHAISPSDGAVGRYHRQADPVALLPARITASITRLSASIS